MKNILYTVLLCLTSIVFSQDQKQTKLLSTDVIITFGRHSLDCSGRGACSFTKTENKTKANTTIFYNKDTTITLVINRSKISIKDEVKILGKSLNESSRESNLTFIMEDDFMLEEEIKTSFKTTKELTKIVKGNYPIQTTKDYFIITLNLE